MTTPVLTVTASKIVESAYRASGITPTKQPVKPYEVERGIEALNFLIKAWQNQDIHLWSKEEAIIPLNVGQRLYEMGPSGDEICNASEFNATNLEADQIATDTVLTVFSTDGMTAAANILTASPTISVQGWTPINSGGVSSDGTELTLTNGAAVAGGAEYSIETEAGERYVLKYTYNQGTTPCLITSAVSGATLDTETLTASGAGELDFVANSDTTTIRIEHKTAISGEFSGISGINYQKVSSGDRIGVQLDDSTREWSHIIDIPTATTVRISTGLSGAATTANLVYNYTNKIDRPLRVLQARYSDTVQGSEIPVNQWSRDEYFDQPDKDSKGSVVQWFYSPQLNKGDLYVWQVANSVNSVLRVTYIRPLDISTDSADSQDIPAEWVNALKWNLASELGAEWGIPESRYVRIEMKARQSLAEALGHDEENSYLQISPDLRGVS